MFVLVLAAEADETRQAITFLIVCLVGVAVLLSALTAWYWRYTSPKRQAAGLDRPAGIPTERAATSAASSDRPVAPASIESADTTPDVSADVPAGAATTAVGDRARVGVVAATTTVEVGGPPAAPSTVSSSSGSSSSGSSSAAARPTGDSPEESRIEVPDRSAGREAMAGRIEIADRRGSGSGAERNGRRATNNGTSSKPPRPSMSSDAAASAPSMSSASAVSSDGVDGESAFPGRRSSRQSGGSRPTVTAEVNGRRQTHVENDDELSEARRRRDRKNEVLSDEDWAAIMKSAFEQMFP